VFVDVQDEVDEPVQDFHRWRLFTKAKCSP
jgi:hypothetical protein